MNDERDVNIAVDFTVSSCSDNYIAPPGTLHADTSSGLKYYSDGTGDQIQLHGGNTFVNYPHLMNAGTTTTLKISNEDRIRELETQMLYLKNNIDLIKVEIASIKKEHNASKIKKRSIFNKNK